MGRGVSRKTFIESHGATCRNWTWSWSFVNHDDRMIIFGAWDTNTQGDRTLILDAKWAVRAGKKTRSYPQSLEHLRLVQEEGYQLYTFNIIYSDELKDTDGNGPAKIQRMERTLVPRSLILEAGGKWYAAPYQAQALIPEEVEPSVEYLEGAVSQVTVNAYERNRDAREACIRHYGAICRACEFDFHATYGQVGKGLIHVHHIVPLATIRKEYVLDPIRDLIPVCANCHAIIHRTRKTMTISTLKKHIAAAKKAKP